MAVKVNTRSRKITYISKLAFVLALTIVLQSFTMVGRVNAVVTSDLTGTFLSNGIQISLNWHDYLTDEKQYVIERKVDSGSFEFRWGASANVTTCVDTFEAGHTYTYRVKVTDSTNTQYIYTNELTINPNDIKIPNSLTITPISYNQIDIKWTYPDQQAYNTIIERKIENDTVWNPLARVGIGQNTYSDKSIVSGVKYYYRVRQYYTDNVITPTYPLDGTGGTYSLLYNPTDLYGFALSQHEIQLTWKDNSVETAFIIERKSPDEGIFKEIAVVPQNNNTYIDGDTSLKPNVIYTYRIKAVTGTTSSEYSNLANVTSTYLRTPAALTSSCGDGKSVKLSWQDLTDGETGFEIWRKTGTSTVWELLETMGRNANTFVDLSVSPEATYSYKVRAKINDNSVYSNFSNETTIWTSTISAPINLAYKAVGKTEIELTWQDTSTIEAGFRVERKIGANGQWYEIAYLEPDTTKYNDKWINSTDIFFYRIKAFDRSNAINYSNEIMVSVNAPDAPTNLQANAISSSEVQLTWEDNSSNESEFVIESMQFYSFQEVGRVSKDTTTFVRKDLYPERTMYFRVKAVNGTIASGTSNEVMVTTKKIVTFSDLSKVAWATDAINNLASRNVFDAKANSKFYPTQNITKGEYCAIVIRSLELSKVSAGKYADVTSKHKYYKEIMTASKLGIITADKDNKIHPDKLITREQAAVMLALSLKVKGAPLPEQDVSTLKQFADYRLISAASADRIAAICGAGIISGRLIGEKPYLQLTSYVTRAEAAAMTYKAINLK